MNQLPTIKVSGRDYVLVKDRILAFNEAYENGSITTELVSAPDADMVVVKAIVIPDIAQPSRLFTGYSQATWGEGPINRTSALENCETSAVGRALAFMGIGVLESIASADEIHKANTQTPYQKKVAETKVLHAKDGYQKSKEDAELDLGEGTIDFG